jgi:predicted alpha/beta hydrolase family esterase
MESTIIMLDLKIAIKHLWSLPLVFGKVPPIFAKNSELNVNSYSTIKDAVVSVKRAILGSSKYTIPPINDTSNIEVFFLNGICTDINVWKLNAAEIEEIFDFKISPLHNPTHGVIPDLIECIFGRTFNILDKETQEIFQTLYKAIKTKDKVIILAHSQGGIIISQLIDHFLDNDIDISNIEVYTFASASDEMAKGNYYVEHFANKYDYVARIGVLEYASNFYGNVFVRKGAGHLLNIHYLQPLSKGEFCVGRSRLSRYLKYKHRWWIESTQ